MNANAEISTLNAALEQLKTQRVSVVKAIQTMDAIKGQINKHQTEITRLGASKVHMGAAMNDLLAEIEETKNRKVLSDDMIEVSVQLIKDLEEITLLRKELTESKKYYDIAAALLKDNGIKTKIIRQYLPIINKLINKHLASMDSFFNFEIDEEFKETIKSRYRDKFQYESFSEGEKFRIDVSLLFTWRALAKLKNSIDTNLLILDEVFDGPLDAQGTDDFLKLLINMASTNVFVISPKGVLMADKFKSVMEFKKEGLFSRIV
jgi:DNA repair exonuclease SbcCD ATPase subunit